MTDRPIAEMLPAPPRLALGLGLVLALAVAGLGGWLQRAGMLTPACARFASPPLLLIHALTVATFCYLVGLAFNLRAAFLALRQVDPRDEAPRVRGWHVAALEETMSRLRPRWADGQLAEVVQRTRDFLEDRLARRWIGGVALAFLLPLVVAWWGAVNLHRDTNFVPWITSFAGLAAALPEMALIMAAASCARAESRALADEWALFAADHARWVRRPGTHSDASDASADTMTAPVVEVSTHPIPRNSKFEELWQNTSEDDLGDPAAAADDDDDDWGRGTARPGRARRDPEPDRDRDDIP